MRHTIIIALLLITLFPNTALAQWGFDAVSVEAYINDHKKQRSLLLARSTLEYSNQLLHEYSSEEVGKYKELNVDLDKYTRAFDIIDVMYQSLRTVLNVKSTYQTVSDRISDYKNLLEDFNDKVIKRKHIELADTMLISINKKAIDNIYNEGSQLYQSVNDLVLYPTGAAACSTSDLLMVLDNINNSLDLIEKHLNQAYFQTWRYVQLRMGYWKEKVYRTRTKEEILEDAFSRWKVAGKLDYLRIVNKKRTDMKKTMILIMAVATTIKATAQSVTYNHDSSKQNQITVMETGGGSLTPEFYYWLLHNNYKKTAAEKNKLGFRTLAGINLYNQVDDAEKIDSALTKRAEVEALNVADRQIDLAWLAESSKINGQLDKMKANIDHIIPTGGTINDKRRWEELYNMYQCAVKATKDAYMPNAQRKRQYLSIYADLTTQNETLLKYLVQLNTQSQTTALLAATNDRVVHKGSIISDAKSRWQENMKGVRSSTGTDGDDANSGEGEESVNR